MEWRYQLLGVPMAWRRRRQASQVALGAKKVAQVRAPGSQSPRHFLRPKRHLAMARRRRQAMGTPSNWERHSIKGERPVTGNAIPLNGNAQ